MTVVLRSKSWVKGKGTIAFIILLSFVAGQSCDEKKEGEEKQKEAQLNETSYRKEAPTGMVWVSGGTFQQGAVDGDEHAMHHEKPQHEVYVDGFYMDIHEVTNDEFKEFVNQTGYITVAEREIDWEEMKKQLPPGTPKPHDSIMQPGSLVFKQSKSSLLNLYDFSQWWEWKIGANWKQPEGPGSDLTGKGDHPVVHIAYEDALAYCEWANRRLPTEAEWEYAARAGSDDTLYFWGNDSERLKDFANTWEGEFPVENTLEDGFTRTAPVMSYPKNEFELYDMAGNVWEWTSDWYGTRYYDELKKQGSVQNPKGPTKPFNMNNPQAREKVIKGGSFLCSESYCASYRVSARMALSTDSGSEHVGFRTVATPNMLNR